MAPALRRRGIFGMMLFLAGWAAAFAPWPVKNAVMTGNPLFPLARSVFLERDGIWNDDGAARWREGHLPSPEDRPLARRLARLWSEVLGAGLPASLPKEPLLRKSPSCSGRAAFIRTPDASRGPRANRRLDTSEVPHAHSAHAFIRNGECRTHGPLPRKSPPRKPARSAGEGVPSPRASIFIRHDERHADGPLVRETPLVRSRRTSGLLAPTPSGILSRATSSAASLPPARPQRPPGDLSFSGSSIFGPVIGLGVIFGIVAIALRHGRVTPGKPEKAASPLEPATTACWLMVIVGLIAWLSWTHLVGRFAVTLIAPATVLLGAGWEAIRTTRVRRGGGVVLAILLAVHTCASVRLLYPELAPLLKAGLVGDATLLPTHLPHLVRLNELVDSGERVLMVGDARRFYLARGVDYCVVFSRNPFAEAAAVRSPEGLLEWLRERRYGYVYVDWLEMNRLRSSRYGFWASINFDLFQQLTDVGLRPVEHFSVENGLAPYGTLYALPPARTGPESRADRRAAAP